MPDYRARRHHPHASWTIANLLDHVEDRLALSRDGKLIVDLLEETSPLYAGRGMVEAQRLWSFILVRAAERGACDAALVYILEVLENSNSATSVAAAAIAVRHLTTVPVETVKLITAAIWRFRSADTYVELRDPDVPPGRHCPTVLVELLRTLKSVAADCEATKELLRDMLDQNSGTISQAVRDEAIEALRAIEAGQKIDGTACCHSILPLGSADSVIATSASRDRVPDLLVQDQSATHARLRALLGGRPSFITFFYTRCENPQRCSLTITKLGRLRTQLVAAGLGEHVNLLGITYDPTFDTPARLRQYGADRGLRFGPETRLLRAVEGMNDIQQWFSLGVGYGPVTVNMHRIDACLLDSIGHLRAEKRRRFWREDEVLEDLVGLINAPRPAEKADSR